MIIGIFISYTFSIFFRVLARNIQLFISINPMKMLSQIFAIGIYWLILSLMIRRVKGQLKNLIRRSDSVNEDVEVENSPSILVNIQISFFFNWPNKANDGLQNRSINNNGPFVWSFPVWRLQKTRSENSWIFRPYVRQIYANFLTHFQIKSPTTIPLSQDWFKRVFRRLQVLNSEVNDGFNYFVLLFGFCWSIHHRQGIILANKFQHSGGSLYNHTRCMVNANSRKNGSKTIPFKTALRGKFIAFWMERPSGSFLFSSIS